MVWSPTGTPTSTLVTDGYIRKIPLDPMTKSADTWIVAFEEASTDPAADATGSFGDPDSTASHHPASVPDETGTLLAGKYKLLERIGEGGMGSVWMAQQAAPVKRKVAVKLIKPGMDSRLVIARFEAECRRWR